MKKIFSIFTMASMVLMAAVSCEKDDDNNALPLPDGNKEAVGTLQGMEVYPKTSYMVIGDTYQLEAVFSPENVGELKVTWSSENPEVAAVDASGKVTALAAGLARISAAAEGKSATAIVNVVGERVPATAIVLNKTEVNTLVGRYVKIRATLEPENTTDKLAIEWSTSNDRIATVESGVVIALAMGEARITASQGNISASCDVSISDKIKLTDRSAAWIMTDTPKWDKNWNGQITGSHVDVNLEGCDADYHVFDIVPAEKGADIESIANDIYMQVEEQKDAGKDPSSLFSKGETQTKAYNDLGGAIAYVLGFDADFEFTGEYATYEFEASEPDPVHATGIQFTQGWSNSPISSIELREGRTLNYFGATLLPEDCTDTGSISFSSTDEAVVTLRPYYSNYYTVVAGVAGEADIVAKFNDIEASIHVTVTGSSIVWTNRSSAWKGHFGIGKLYSYDDVFGFTLEECSSPSHFISVVTAEDAGSDPWNNYRTIANQNADQLDWYASSDLPDFSGNWGDTDDTIERYAYVFGVSGGAFDGNYAVFHYIPGGGPTDDPGKIIKFSNTIFRAEIPASRATATQGTLEAWINVSSTSGCQNIIGAESNFLLRIDGGQLDYVYGGTIDSRGEVGENHVRTSISTGEWHHVAATYTQNGKAVLYVDGSEVGSGNTEDHPVYMDGKTKNDNTYPCWGLPFRFYIGSGNDKHHYEGGSIAYARVWDKALSASEISSNMKKDDISDSHLLGYWKFNEGSGNTITDYSGNGITLSAQTSNGATATATLSDANVEWIDGNLPF